MRQCVRCLLPEAVPGADLDDTSVCRVCREYDRANHALREQHRKDREADLEKTLRDCRGHGEYDCLVNLSGGKDSCYLLYKLVKEYGLHVLAFTTDMNVPPVAWANIRRTVDRLGVDHVVYRPTEDFYRKLFRFLLQNQEARGAVRTVCYVCAPLFEGYALRTAVEKNIPLVVAGYSPGQPEPERMEYEFSSKLIAATDWTPTEVRDSGLFSDEELTRFWNPLRFPAGTRFPRYLAPFHAWPYNQTEIMDKVVKRGLIANHKSANPIHSNCPVNWLLMYSDLQNLGYNPYAPEFSALIREGKASRRYWRIITPIVNFMIRYKVFLGRNVSRSLKWLGLKPTDLRVTHSVPDEQGRLALPMLEPPTEELASLHPCTAERE